VFELDLRAGELRRQGMKVKLQEQPFQVLMQLLEKPGEVVTREELRNRLWPADTFVDFDHSLNAAIWRVRCSETLPRTPVGDSGAQGLSIPCRWMQATETMTSCRTGCC
jgi:DNA-binding response OmpR family regulator